MAKLGEVLANMGKRMKGWSRKRTVGNCRGKSTKK